MIKTINTTWLFLPQEEILSRYCPFSASKAINEILILLSPQSRNIGWFELINLIYIHVYFCCQVRWRWSARPGPRGNWRLPPRPPTPAQATSAPTMTRRIALPTPACVPPVIIMSIVSAISEKFHINTYIPLCQQNMPDWIKKLSLYWVHWVSYLLSLDMELRI